MSAPIPPEGAAVATTKYQLLSHGNARLRDGSLLAIVSLHCDGWRVHPFTQDGHSRKGHGTPEEAIARFRNVRLVPVVSDGEAPAMAEPQRTEAPWRAARGNKRTMIYSINGGTVAQVYRDEDAALVAAAPDLLKAVQRARAYLRNPEFDPGMRDGIAHLLEAAIAKAEGAAS